MFAVDNRVLEKKRHELEVQQKALEVLMGSTSGEATGTGGGLLALFSK